MGTPLIWTPELSSSEYEHSKNAKHIKIMVIFHYLMIEDHQQVLENLQEMAPDFGTLKTGSFLAIRLRYIKQKKVAGITIISYLVRKLLNKAEPPLTRVTEKKTGHLGFKRLRVSQMWHAGANVCRWEVAICLFLRCL